MRAWTAEQMMFMHALHTFATSYFAGNVKITEQADGAKPNTAAKEGAAAANAANGAATTITTKKLERQPGQKEKVTAAITAYVASPPRLQPRQQRLSRRQRRRPRKPYRHPVAGRRQFRHFPAIPCHRTRAALSDLKLGRSKARPKGL